MSDFDLSHRLMENKGRNRHLKRQHSKKEQDQYHAWQADIDHLFSSLNVPADNNQISKCSSHPCNGGAPKLTIGKIDDFQAAQIQDMSVGRSSPP